MRLKVTLSKTDILVPFDNQKNVLGYFHKLLGDNNKWHDKQSTYCLSLLMGGKLKNHMLDFSQVNGTFYITSNDEELINTILERHLDYDNFAYDMRVLSIDLVTDEIFDGYNHFLTLSPIFLKDSENRHLTFKDEGFEDKLYEQTVRKLKAINPKLSLNGFSLKVNGKRGKLKLIDINGIKNKVSHCIVTVNSSKEIANLLYTYGLGQSTGAGFGSLMKLENTEKYLQ